MNQQQYSWHQTAWQQIHSMLDNQRMPHALIITGITGLAKADFAQQLASNMLCLQPNNHQACGQCHSCQLMMAASHPDHLYIGLEESSKVIKVDQIRQLKDKQSLTPNIGQWKTVIIHPAEAMNINASNSLLKLLEEPPANTLIILVSDSASLLPITIRSRCQTLQMTAADIEQSRQWLLAQDISIHDDDLARLHALTGGAPLQIKRMFEQGSLDSLSQAERDFEQLLKGQGNVIQLAQDWQNLDLSLLFQQLQLWVGEQIKSTMLGKQSHSPSLPEQQLWRVLDCINATIKLISSQNNFNKILLIEDFMVSIVQSTSSHKMPSQRAVR